MREFVTALEHEKAASDGATPPALRETVFRRDGHQCQSCGAMRHLHAHHIEWRSRGGKTVIDNLVTLCSKCHGLIHEGFLEVAQCAKRDGRLVCSFEDLHGRPRDHFVRDLPRLKVAQCATQGEELPAEVDGRWFLEHEDWFETRGGTLRLKARYRDLALAGTSD